jgi:DNA (cytosine-5)-methyltransferase 1
MNYYNEFDPNAAAWLRELIKAKLIPNGYVDERSIADVKPADLARFTQCHFFAGIGGWSLALKLAGWPEDREVWTGSCPCQPFSSSGGRLAQSDARHLWPSWFRLIRERKPDAIFQEQVESAIAFGWLDDVCSDLEGIDHACWPAVLSAGSVRAPQPRPRLYIASFSARFRLERPRPLGRRVDSEADCFGEANRFVDAVSRRSLPFVCSSHNGFPAGMAKRAAKHFGNAIVPRVAAEFIQASTEAIESLTP